MSNDATPRLGLPFLAAGQAQKEVTHNEALALADAAICPAVQAVSVDAPPTNPVLGQCWIVGAAPTGAWAGRAQALAIWTSGGWRFVPAVDGLQAWVLSDRVWAVRDGGVWRVGECDRPITLIERKWAGFRATRWDKPGRNGGFLRVSGLSR